MLELLPISRSTVVPPSLFDVLHVYTGVDRRASLTIRGNRLGLPGVAATPPPEPSY